MKLLITCLFLGVSFVMMSSSFAQSDDLSSIPIEPDAYIYKGITREEANSAIPTVIRLHGYRCDSISHIVSIPPITRRLALAVFCNQFEYGYKIEDNGETLTVTII